MFASASKETCARLYLTLLELLDNKNPESVAIYYAREIANMSSCGGYTKFRGFQTRFNDHVEDQPGGVYAMDRIEGYTHDQRDIERATQAMIHFKQEHRRMLESELPLPHRIYYRTRGKAEGILTMVGLGAAILAGGRGLAPMIVRARARAHTFFG